MPEMRAGPLLDSNRTEHGMRMGRPRVGTDMVEKPIDLDTQSRLGFGKARIPKRRESAREGWVHEVVRGRPVVVQECLHALTLCLGDGAFDLCPPGGQLQPPSEGSVPLLGCH